METCPVILLLEMQKQQRRRVALHTDTGWCTKSENDPISNMGNVFPKFPNEDHSFRETKTEIRRQDDLRLRASQQLLLLLNTIVSKCYKAAAQILCPGST
jgi:hypothetical protein